MQHVHQDDQENSCVPYQESQYYAHIHNYRMHQPLHELGYRPVFAQMTMIIGLMIGKLTSYLLEKLG